MMKKWLIVLGVIMLACGLTACGVQEAPDDPDSPGVGQAPTPETVYLGVLLPGLNANTAIAGQIKAAMEIAVDIINSSHNIDWELAQSAGLRDYGNARVELRFVDCGSTAASATAAVKSLHDLGVTAIIGAYNADMTAAAAMACARWEMPMIAGSAKGAALTDGSYDFRGFFYRLASTDKLETAMFMDYVNQLNLTEDLGLKKAAIAYIDNSYGQHASGVLEDAIAASPLEQTALIGYAPTDSDMVEEAAKIVATQPDVIFQISSTTDLIGFANAYAQTRYLPKVLLCYSGGFQKSEFSAAVNRADLDFYMGAMVCPDLTYQPAPGKTDDPKARATALFAYINALYKDKTGVNMDNAALLEFAGVIVTAQAVAQSGTTQREALLLQLADGVFDAPYLYSASIDFDEQGQNSITPAYVAKIVNGKYCYVY